MSYQLSFVELIAYNSGQPSITVPVTLSVSQALVNCDARVDAGSSEYVYGQELPGISMSELADHFCDFLALNKLRVWAEQNLSVVNPETS